MTVSGNIWMNNLQMHMENMGLEAWRGGQAWPRRRSLCVCALACLIKLRELTVHRSIPNRDKLACALLFDTSTLSISLCRFLHDLHHVWGKHRCGYFKELKVQRADLLLGVRIARSRARAACHRRGPEAELSRGLQAVPECAGLLHACAEMYVHSHCRAIRWGPTY